MLKNVGKYVKQNKNKEKIRNVKKYMFLRKKSFIITYK